MARLGDDPLEGLDTEAIVDDDHQQPIAGSNRPPDIRKLAGSLGLTVMSVVMLIGGFWLSQVARPSDKPMSTSMGVAAVNYPVQSLTPVPELPTFTLTPTPAPSRTPELPALTSDGPATEASIPAIDTHTSVPTPVSTFPVASATPIPSRVTQQLVAPLPTKGVVCVPATYWVTYYVKRGDTLYSLARRTNSSVTTIMRGNCLVNTTIYVGQRLYLPSWPAAPTSRPGATATRTATSSPTSTATGTSDVTSTPTPTNTLIVDTVNATQSPTETQPPTATSTLPPTATSTSPPPPTATSTVTSPLAPPESRL